jgi:uncharacterized protein (DUF1778 family)
MELRLTAQQKSEIEQAAALSGRTVTDFALALLTREAAEVIRAERSLTLTRESWDAFANILELPAKPLTALGALLTRAPVAGE